MDDDLFVILEKRVVLLLKEHHAMKQVNSELVAENRRLIKERLEAKKRLDALISKLEGAV